MNNSFILLVGRSGSGKSTIANYLASDYGMRVIDSYTTRKPRFKDESGHRFVTDEEFDALETLVAFTKFDGAKYGATTQQVEEADLYVIDISGVEYFKEHYTGSKTIKVVYLAAQPSTVFNRMLDRGVSMKDITKRMDNDRVAFAATKVADMEDLYPSISLSAILDKKYITEKMMRFFRKEL